MKLPILKFVPIFKTVLWGGQRIADFKGLPSQGSHVGESWELSPMPGRESVAITPPFAGRTLTSIIDEYGKDILGQRIYEETNGNFPLLIKLIDADDDLSIQVHPDARMEAEGRTSNGKNELWYSIAPREGAYLYAGFNTDVNPDVVGRKIGDKTIVDALRKFYTAPGDVFYIPAGCVHSLGPGNLVLEIQEASDITYRVYDYDRRDADGNARELHVREGLEVMDYDMDFMALCRFKPQDNKEVEMVKSRHFTTTFHAVDAPVSVPLVHRNSFSVFVAVKGSAKIVDDCGRETSIARGETVLVPASIKSIQIVPEAGGTVELVSAYR